MNGTHAAISVPTVTNPALQAAAEHPWTDVILARINHRHKRMDNDADTDGVARTLKRAREGGKGVIGMKIFGCGDLSTQEDRSASMRYVLENDLVHCMTIGFTSPAQIDDTMAGMDRILQA